MKDLKISPTVTVIFRRTGNRYHYYKNTVSNSMLNGFVQYIFGRSAVSEETDAGSSSSQQQTTPLTVPDTPRDDSDGEWILVQGRLKSTSHKCSIFFALSIISLSW